MSTDLQQPTLTNIVLKPRKPTPIKVGWFGAQGSGKTTSAALLSLALSKEIYGGAPVYVTDTEPGWQFLKPLFAIEGVELIQRTDPTFKGMTRDLREAERLGACAWSVDTLTVIWTELMQSFKARNHGYIPIDKWGDIREMWNKDYVSLFLNSPMCCQALGRLGSVQDEIQTPTDENPDKTKLVKTGTRFKAGGSEDFGYEPHLLLEVSTERKARKVAGSVKEGEGRMIHRVDVLKDRTWALNGKVIRFSDKPRYEKGGYRTVWEAIKPHWDAVQATTHVQVETATSSIDLISGSGDTNYRQRLKQCVIACEEIKGTLVDLWPGETAAAKAMKSLAVKTVFQTHSWTKVEAMPLGDLELGLETLRGFVRQAEGGHDAMTDTAAASSLLEMCAAQAKTDLAALANGHDLQDLVPVY